MKYKFIKYFVSLLFILPCVCAKAQQPASDEEQEKKLYEMIQEQVTRYVDLLDLEYWQEFYVDSILTHDYKAMQEELMTLSKSKMSIQDAYIRVQDKWSEAMYRAMQAVFTEEQWQRYLKSGAARDKKARDKRESKRSE